MTSYGAGQGKIREICTANEQNKASGPRHNEQNRLNIADNLFTQRNYADSAVQPCVRMFADKLLRHDVHSGARLFERNAGFDTSYYIQPMVITMDGLILVGKQR